jgi:hypothetical protein
MSGDSIIKSYQIPKIKYKIFNNKKASLKLEVINDSTFSSFIPFKLEPTWIIIYLLDKYGNFIKKFQFQIDKVKSIEVNDLDWNNNNGIITSTIKLKGKFIQ